MVKYKGWQIHYICGNWFIRKANGKYWILAFSYEECKQMINERVRTSK